MHDMVNEFYTEDPDKVVREPETPDCEKFDACDKITTCITPMTSVCKQPRMNNVLRFHGTADDDESKYMFDFYMFLFNSIIIPYLLTTALYITLHKRINANICKAAESNSTDNSEDNNEGML